MDLSTHQFSETWDPSAHVRLQFPSLGNPDARPEQAPSQGVRELLFQYEAAVQDTSREPLNIFWNDEQDRGTTDELLLRNVEDPPPNNSHRRNRMIGTLVVAGVIILCSLVTLIVGTVCVMGKCGDQNEGKPDAAMTTLIVTRYPTAAPSSSSNIFAQPASASPTEAPASIAQRPTTVPEASTSDANLSNTTYPPTANATNILTNETDAFNTGNATDLNTATNETTNNNTTTPTTEPTTSSNNATSSSSNQTDDIIIIANPNTTTATSNNESEVFSSFEMLSVLAGWHDP